MVMMRGYRIGQNGHIDRVWADTERWPDGYVDSPDKLKAAPVEEPEPYRAPTTTPQTYGEIARPWPRGKRGR